MNEINEFKKEGKVNILTIEATENTRYEFIKKRKREDVTFELEEFKKEVGRKNDLKEKSLYR